MFAKPFSCLGNDRPGRGGLLRSVLSGVLAMAALGFAQSPSPTLAGKTVRVFHPVPGEPLFVDISGVGHPMAPMPDPRWMTCTLPDTISAATKNFGIRNNFGQGNFWIGPYGIDPLGTTRFLAEDFRGGDTLWVVIDPSGPPKDATGPAIARTYLLKEAPKEIRVLNPWPTTAPVLVFASGKRRGMLHLPDDCGWFWAFLFDPTEYGLRFEEVNGADAYGADGPGSRLPVDLGPVLASQGPRLWLDTEVNAWLGADPGKNRPCGYLMAATVRDFSMSHPDFDFDNVIGEQWLHGMVQPNLGPARKPVRTATTSPYFNRFEEWFTTVPGTNAETCVDLPMGKTADGMWQYDSYETPERGFWPIDNFANPHNEKTKASCYVKPDGSTWVTGGPAHNMNFCLESHATFVYRQGQKFEFRGDDDVWVYINGKLVVDLGGLHTPKAVEVDLDALNLVPGQSYPFDFFSCDRQPCGSSLKIKTSIFFKQQRALEAVPDADKPGSYRIVKYSGGSGACASTSDSIRQVPVTNLTYELRNAAGFLIKSLGEGSFHGGGIVIATPVVSVDTSKIRDLPPGNYRLLAYEAANSQVRAEIPFTLARGSRVEFEPPFNGTYPKSSAARLVVAHREAGIPVAQAAPYSLVIPGGLQVYGDSARTQAIASGTVLATSVTGMDTLWAVCTQEEDRTYILSLQGSTKTMMLTFLKASSSIRAELGRDGKPPAGAIRRDALGRRRLFGLPFSRPAR